MGSNTAKKTCLYDFHIKEGGKMVDFAGYLLPIQYGKEGITNTSRGSSVLLRALFGALVASESVC